MTTALQKLFAFASARFNPPPRFLTEIQSIHFTGLDRESHPEDTVVSVVPDGSSPEPLPH